MKKTILCLMILPLIPIFIACKPAPPETAASNSMVTLPDPIVNEMSAKSADPDLEEDRPDETEPVLWQTSNENEALQLAESFADSAYVCHIGETEVAFNRLEGPISAIADFTMVATLESDQHALLFAGEEGQYLNVYEKSGNWFEYKLISIDGTHVEGVELPKRYLFDESYKSARQFYLPETGRYRLSLSGTVGAVYDLLLKLESVPYPVMGELQSIPLDAGSGSVRLTGKNDDYSLDRYIFSGKAGQSLSFDMHGVQYLWVEGLLGSGFYHAGEGPIVLPADDEYIITVYYAADTFLYGPYDFTLTLSDLNLAQKETVADNSP